MLPGVPSLLSLQLFGYFDAILFQLRPDIVYLILLGGEMLGVVDVFVGGIVGSFLGVVILAGDKVGDLYQQFVVNLAVQHVVEDADAVLGRDAGGVLCWRVVFGGRRRFCGRGLGISDEEPQVPVVGVFGRSLVVGQYPSADSFVRDAAAV